MYQMAKHVTMCATKSSETTHIFTYLDSARILDPRMLMRVSHILYASVEWGSLVLIREQEHLEYTAPTVWQFVIWLFAAQFLDQSYPVPQYARLSWESSHFRDNILRFLMRLPLDCIMCHCSVLALLLSVHFVKCRQSEVLLLFSL